MITRQTQMDLHTDAGQSDPYVLLCFVGDTINEDPILLKNKLLIHVHNVFQEIQPSVFVFKFGSRGPTHGSLLYHKHEQS